MKLERAEEAAPALSLSTRQRIPPWVEGSGGSSLPRALVEASWQLPAPVPLQAVHR